jgi:PhnB protein
MADLTPRITPYLLYEDLGGALEWLARAFGLRERLRQAGPDGKPSHAEMTLGDDGVILMGGPPPPYRNPKRLGGVTQNLYVRVDDVDSLFRRAVEAGAVVLEKPADQPYGDRRCGVEDPEGHRWYFAQTITPAG